MVKYIDKTEFKSAIDSDKLSFISFSATWCQPCTMLTKLVTSWESEYPSIYFAKVDVDAEGELSKEYNISSMPTTILFHKGKELFRLSGIKKDIFLLKINEYSALIEGEQKVSEPFPPKIKVLT